MNEMFQNFKGWYKSQPLFTRTYLSILIIVSVLVKFKLLPLDKMYLDFDTLSRFHVWRLITAHLFLDKLSLGLLFQVYFIFMAMSALEGRHDRQNYADFVWMMFLFFAMSTLIGLIVELYFLAVVIKMAVIYLWSRYFSEHQIMIYFFFKLKAAYICWALVAFDLLLGDGSQVVSYLVGILIAYLYYYLKVIYYEQTHKDYIPTPRFLYYLNKEELDQHFAGQPAPACLQPVVCRQGTTNSIKALIQQAWDTRELGSPNFYIQQEEGLLIYVNTSLNRKESRLLLSKNVVEQFDFKDFNFTKADPKEVLLVLDLQNGKHYPYEAKDQLQDVQDPPQLHYLLNSAAPFATLHSLLVPFPDEHLPQVISCDILTEVMSLFYMEQDPDLRMGYNGIGGSASVNHLHLQLLYMDSLLGKGCKLPVEKAQLKLLKSHKFMNYEQNVSISVTQDYPLPAIVLQVQKGPDEMKALCFGYGLFMGVILSRNVPHNFMITDLGRKIFIFPRRFQAQFPEMEFRVGFLQASGVGVSQKKTSGLRASLEQLRLPFFDELVQDGIGQLK